MTRINAGVDPSELWYKHLLSEARELIRVPNAIRNGIADLTKPIPPHYKLNKGHVRFFYNKLGYLFKRYQRILKECKRRGYKVQDFSSSWEGIPKELMGDYTPSERDRQITLKRIEERLRKAGQI